MNTYDILVIVLSITLGIFLIVGIILIISLIKLVGKLREITAKAEDIVGDVEAVSGFFRKTAGPVAITGLISNIVSTVADLKGKKGKEK